MVPDNEGINGEITHKAGELTTSQVKSRFYSTWGVRKEYAIRIYFDRISIRSISCFVSVTHGVRSAHWRLLTCRQAALRAAILFRFRKEIEKEEKLAVRRRRRASLQKE